MKRKYLSLILAVVMVLGTLTTVANAAPTNNVKVDWLIEKGFVEGYADGTYGLEKTITRAEVATMVVRTLGKEEDAVKSMNIISLFTDMNTSDVLWSRGYVTIAAFEGIVNGYLDGTFGPKKDITYAEVATMLVRVLGGLNKDEEKLATGVNWATIYLTKANQLGIFEGVEVSDYSALAVRGKIFEMVYNVISKTPDTGLEAYKGIVIENTRVSGLDKGEIAIEVIEKSTGAATHRYDTGSNVRIKLKDLKEDTNYLLGKVVDVTINESNEATRLTIDNSYSYITGQTVFNKDELTINDKTYGL
ncbi:MAG TPA: S-layer homology domain-containing protein, partial [Tissierellaceae bacterium]|nr:S-layer homology domain-containing protein [Tissierellaceae bacterium]